jgi:hypothetical protein
MRALGAEVSEAGFDLATLTDPNGQESTWSRDQFQGLSLLDKVRLLAGGNVRFFRNGVEIPAREALKGL